MLQPESIDLSSIGQLEGFTHQATLLYLNENLAFEKLAEVILDKLSCQKNISYGLSKLPVNGVIVRILGYKAEQLFDLLHIISNIINTSDQETERTHLNVA